MKQHKNQLCFAILIMLYLALVLPSHAPVSAAENIFSAQIVSDSANLSEGCADDRVLVVLSNEASLKFDSYSVADFPEVACKSTIDLTQSMGEKLELQMANADIAPNITSNSVSTSRMNSETYHQILCLELEETGIQNVLDTIKALQDRDDVIYAGPDFEIMPFTTIPNDLIYAEYTHQIHENIHTPEAWDITTGSSSVKVGVIDSGIDITHPDLSDRVDTELSRDFTASAGSAFEDSNGHGTFVAGIIGAEGHNIEGICGVCWDVRLVSLKVFGSGIGYVSYLISAINYAEHMDIPILNFSGGYGIGGIYDIANNYSSELASTSHPLYAAIRNYSGLFVCSAGNDADDEYDNGIMDNDQLPVYPANYRLPNLISVGASNELNTRDSNSRYGSDTVDLFAPGAHIVSCTLGNDYVYYATGYTSFSAPYVTGVAALLLSEYPELSASDIRHIILTSVDEFASLENLCVSGGRLNAYNALLTAEGFHHNWDCSNISVSAGHGWSCDECVSSYSEPHTWMEFISFYKCSKCLVTSTHIAINSDDLPVELLGSTMPDEFSVSVDANTVLCRVDGQFYLVKGYSETAALQFLKNELSVSDSTVTE